MRAGSRRWLEKFYGLNEAWEAEDRRKLLAFARDLLNSDYAGHRLTFVQFAQAPHFNHLAAVYGAFDFSGPLDFVRIRRAVRQGQAIAMTCCPTTGIIP